MKFRGFAVALLLASLAIPANAGFNEVLGGLESRLGRTTWIPLFGLARVGVRVIHPDGVHDIQLAVFEGKGTFDSLEADRLMRSRIGGGYTPLVRVRSKHDHEWSFIYARSIGNLMDLVVLSNDGSDTALVRVVVDPEVVSRYVREDPRNVALVARH
ncbi:MAG TPA: hypothetical protein VLV78_06645 [Thermoanaerobaculia bacterium]|nr:hypothetical protein [Thermoanaerobaculia bacterium]